MSGMVLRDIIHTRPTTTKHHIMIGASNKLTLLDAKLLAHKALPVSLNPDAYDAMQRSYQFLKTCIEQGMPIYGINTHFGDQISFLDAYLHDPAILPEEYKATINDRQNNLIKSHTCSLGNVVPSEIVKIALMLRAHCLAQGYSGVRPETVEALLAYLNAGITPLVRSYGSIGASGDLIPLATIAAGLTGKNVEVLYLGEIMQAHHALKLAGLKAFEPEMREGLAMINGTSFMTALASLAFYDLSRLFRQMLTAIAMALESMMVITSGYTPLVHQLKNHTGEMNVNTFMLSFWQGSQLVTDLDELRNHPPERPMQDYYSLRSVSQGFGPFNENLERAIDWVEEEMNSVNDNPIIDAKAKKIHHSANFMGYYITDACDILKMDIAQASMWIHALLANLVHPRKSHGLPANLVGDPGTQNGFRPIQLLAAALATQNRKLAQSHQAYTLPTEGDNQDVNSLGTHASFDLQESVANLERLTAILLLAATQALELKGIEKAGQNSQEIYHIIRECSSPLAECRPMTNDLMAIIDLLNEEKI